MKKKDTISELDLWNQAADLFADLEPAPLPETYVRIKKFIKLLIKSKFKLTKLVKDELNRNEYDQMFFIEVSANLAKRNLATTKMLDEIWSPFFEAALEYGPRSKELSAPAFIDNHVLDEKGHFNIQVSVIIERLLMRKAVDLIKPLYNSRYDKWIFEKNTKKTKKYINTHKPIKDIINQIRYSKDNTGKKIPYRTAEILDIAYPGWEKNKNFFVKKKDLENKRKLY